MDTLAAALSARGKPCISVNWSAWSDTGMAADRGLLTHLQEAGLGVIDPRTGFRALEAALTAGRPQITVFPVDWPRFLKHSQQGGYSETFLSNFTGLKSPSPGQTDVAVPVASANGTGLSKSLSFKSRLTAAPANRRRDVVVEQIRSEVAQVLGLHYSESLPNNKPLNELGMDSLMAVEMRGRLGNAVERTLPATLLFDYPTVDALTDYLSRNILRLEESPVEIPTLTTSPSAGLDVLLSEIEGLDDAEIDRLLEEKGIRSAVGE
jgi:acyl carrier protein